MVVAAYIDAGQHSVGIDPYPRVRMNSTLIYKWKCPSSLLKSCARALPH
jgi:hypothetical protein